MVTLPGSKAALSQRRPAHSPGCPAGSAAVPSEPSRQRHHSLHVKLHKSPQCSSLGAVPVLQKAPPCGATMGRSIRQSTFSSSCLMTDVQPMEPWDWRSTAEALYNSCSFPPSSASPRRDMMMDGDITDCSQSR